MKTEEIERQMRDVLRHAKMVKTLSTLEARIDQLTKLVENVATAVQWFAKSAK